MFQVGNVLKMESVSKESSNKSQVGCVHARAGVQLVPWFHACSGDRNFATNNEHSSLRATVNKHDWSTGDSVRPRLFASAVGRDRW